MKWDLGNDDLLPLWVADMDFPAPLAVRAALEARVAHGIFGYGQVTESFVESLVAFHLRRHGRKLDPRHFVFASGIMPGVRAAIRAFTNPGDEIVVQAPVYPPFFSVAQDEGRSVLVHRLVQDAPGAAYRMDVGALESQVGERTRMILLCSPHNPVGRVWSARELADLAALAAAQDLVVVTDEIHCDLLSPRALGAVPRFAGPKPDGARGGDGSAEGSDRSRGFLGFADAHDAAAARTVTCLSGGKTFNIAGLPAAGLFVADNTMRGRLKDEISRAGVGMPNVLALVAAEAAFREGDTWLDEVLQYVDGNRAFLERELLLSLPEVRVTPAEGTYLAWLDFRALGLDNAELKRRIKGKGKLWLSPGKDFGPGGEGFMRLNLACPRATLEEACSRLVAVL